VDSEKQNLTADFHGSTLIGSGLSWRSKKIPLNHKVEKPDFHELARAEGPE